MLDMKQSLRFHMPPVEPLSFPDRVFDVRDFGAVGDGTTSNAQAFRRAIEVCHGEGGGVVLIPAGTWHWPRAIVFLVVYGFLALVSIIALARYAPASLEARLQPPVAKDQPVADRFVSLFLILSICAWFLFIPIDVFHLRLLPAPHLTISILGAALFLAGFGVILTASLQNAFAAPIVKDQSDRGHVLSLLQGVARPSRGRATVAISGSGDWRWRDLQAARDCGGWLFFNAKELIRTARQVTLAS